MMDTTITTIDAYIAGFPPETQALLTQMRTTIQNAAPLATETISYGMPTFVQHGVLVHFAAFKNHIGFYATPTGNEAFADVLTRYKVGKGSIQFPVSEPLPLDLVSEMVQFRVIQNEEKAAQKKKK